jgi:hypothetical protein
MVAGASFLWGTKGNITGFLLLSALNAFRYYYQADIFWLWEIMIAFYSLLGGIVNYLLNKKTDKLRLVKVLTGSAVSLLSWGLFTPLIPGLFIWSILVGLPLVFSYRNIPKAFYLQLIFKFIFSTGWIIIGNILY